jgi:O-antigen biosynthesis protein
LSRISPESPSKIIQLYWEIIPRIAPKNSFRGRFINHFSKKLQGRYNKLAFMNPVNVYDYPTWIAFNEYGLEELNHQSRVSDKFLQKPLISIIMPVFNTPVNYLRSAIESVLSQTYPNWELCIANGNPQADWVIEILNEYNKKDERIKIIQLLSNLGIAGNSNEAIELVNGEFIAFLDHDDCLAPFALFEIVTAVNQHSKVDIVYSDEDKLSSDGKRRFDPLFKPAYSHDFLLSCKYMPHFLVIRRDIGDRIGWLRDGFDGSQDYDLVLRASEISKLIVHIPKVLYHWRAIPGSTSYSPQEKSYSVESGRKACQDHIDRLGLPGEVTLGSLPNTYQVTYKIQGNPKVSIIIPNRDHVEDLSKCITSIVGKSTYENIEIIVVENGSISDETFKYYDQLESKSDQEKLNLKIPIKVIDFAGEFNYSAINNYAVECASSQVLLFLNNDTEVISSDWLERKLEHVQRSEVGAVGAKLYYPNYRIQHAGVILRNYGAGHAYLNFHRKCPGSFGRLQLIQNFSAVTGACMMVRREVFDEVGGFDENFKLSYGDVDLCLKLRKLGYSIIWTPYAELYHHESKTRGYENTTEKKKRLDNEWKQICNKWNSELMKGDFFYNPNLSEDNLDFSVSTHKVLAVNRVIRKEGLKLFSE